MQLLQLVCCIALTQGCACNAMQAVHVKFGFTAATRLMHSTHYSCISNSMAACKLLSGVHNNVLQNLGGTNSTAPLQNRTVEHYKEDWLGGGCSAHHYELYESANLST